MARDMQGEIRVLKVIADGMTHNLSDTDKAVVKATATDLDDFISEVKRHPVGLRHALMLTAQYKIMEAIDAE